MDEITKPFDVSYSPQFAELLSKLNISLILSTYQAGKVITHSPVEGDKLVQLPRTFDNAMGLAVKDDAIAVATKHEVKVMRSAKPLAQTYPQKVNVYDDIYIPRSSYYTGQLALHDMEYVSNGRLIATNTLYSCLCYVDDKYNFTPFWQPPFITDLKGEDRCHLNGIAVQDNEVKYATALGKSNDANGWRGNKMNGGILMEVPSGEIILEGLSMPHSPRIFNDELYLLNSAKGELICVDPKTKSYDVVVNLGGFARGMVQHGDYLFIGVSKLRHNSQVFRDLPIAKTSFAGIIAVYLPYKSIVGSIKYEMSVDEIYDVKILVDTIRPNIISPEMEIRKYAFSTPEAVFWKQTEAEGKPTEERTEKEKPTSNENSYSLRLVKNISSSDLLNKFKPLLISEYAEELKINRPSTLINAVVGIHNNKAVGLIVFEVTKDKTAKITSVYVTPENRKKRVATNMLKAVQDVLNKSNINYSEALINEATSNSDITKSLFNNFKSINLLLIK